jgi:hypothetical protein
MMKKNVKIILLVSIVIITLLILNINVATKKGVNYRWYTIKVPLYLKVLDFFDRHYNYRQLVKGIVKDAGTREQKAIQLFNWVHQNMRKAPEGLPIVDDHVWYIIVRGYGVADQFSDVFTTLCNYAGLDAFYDVIYTKDKTDSIHFSFVKLNKGWSLFDPYYGVYFKNRAGNIATLEEMKTGNCFIVNIGKNQRSELDYGKFMDSLPGIKAVGLGRANIQSPLKRFIYELNKIKKH